MYTFIKETNGKEVEYTVIDKRDYKEEGRFTNEEDAKRYINILNNRLYQGSGVLGNSI